LLIARAAADPESRAKICDQAVALIDPVELPELRAAVLAMRDGQASFLDAFVARFDPREPESRTAAAGRISVQVLRESLSIDGRAVRLAPKEIGLLGFLSYRRGAVSREETQDALWPELDEDAARDSLYSLLYRLRKRLGRFEIVTSIGNGYRLADGVHVDLWEIEALSERLRQGRHADSFDRVARAYDGLRNRRLPHVETYEWFAGMDFHIHEYIRIFARYLAERAKAAQDEEATRAYANALIVEDPCDEWAHQTLIGLYLERGEREKAASAYRNYCTLLKREVGGQPSREIRELVEGLIA
jgi:DNA-binding SARP family transcriptional activator